MSIHDQVLYVCLEKFEMGKLYSALDVARWLNMPKKHRLLRYYLNALARKGHLLRVVIHTKYGKRVYYCLPEMETYLRSMGFEYVGGVGYVMKRR